jgi:hypothetical protein
MKDAVVTVRLPAEKRRRIERMAAVEGRSLSQLIERLLDRAMGAASVPVEARPTESRPRARSLAGVLAGGRVPTLRDFFEARASLGASVAARIDLDAERRG